MECAFEPRMARHNFGFSGQGCDVFGKKSSITFSFIHSSNAFHRQLNFKARFASFVFFTACLWMSSRNGLSRPLNVMDPKDYPTQMLLSTKWPCIQLVSGKLPHDFHSIFNSNFGSIWRLQVVKIMKHLGWKRTPPNCTFHRIFSTNWCRTHFYIELFYGKCHICDDDELKKKSIKTILWIYSIIRLHQRNPDTVVRSDKSQQQSEEQPVSCSEPEDMVRVTVSILVKRHIRGGNSRIGTNANSGNNRRGK